MSLLEDKVILITGSSDGLGRVLALHFMERGAKVVFHGRSMEKLRNLTDDFDDLDDWLIVPGDLANEEDCKRLVNLTIQKFGQLDVLVNNSVTIMRDSMSQHSLSEFDQLLSINLHAIGFLSELCAPYLSKTNGKILNVNSLSAFFGFLQHPFAEITRLAYEQFNRHAIKLYNGVDVKLLDPCPYFEELHYLADFCFTYKQQLHQWSKANRQLEESGQFEKLAINASIMLLK